jgi:hypothetical protein
MMAGAVHRSVAFLVSTVVRNLTNLTKARFVPHFMHSTLVRSVVTSRLDLPKFLTIRPRMRYLVRRVVRYKSATQPQRRC